MRVCKHGCGVKMFNLLFTRNLKKFSSSKLDKFTLFTIYSSAETWKIVTKKVCQFFFA